MDTEHLNISFLKGLPTEAWQEGKAIHSQNEIDRMILRLAEMDGKGDELSIEDVRLAYKDPDPTLSKISSLGLSAEWLFRDLRSYLSRLWIYREMYSGTKKGTADDAVWIRLVLTTETDLKEIRELVSIFTFIMPNVGLSEIIGRALFQVREETLVAAALEAAERLSSEEIRGLLLLHRSFKDMALAKSSATSPSGARGAVEKEGGGREGIILRLLDIAFFHGQKGVGFSNVLLEIIEGEKESVLKKFLSDILRFKRKLEDATKPRLDDIIALRTFVSEEEEEARGFKYPPPANTFGACVARVLANIGVADRKVVSKIKEILKGAAYSDEIKANCLYSLREMEYDSEGTKRDAARIIYELARRMPVKTDEDGNLSHYTLQVPIALGKLGFAWIDGDDVVDALARFVYYRRYAELRMVALYGLGLLGTDPKTSTADRTKILGIISDLIGDPESQVVGNAAYIWYEKVWKKVYHETNLDKGSSDKR